MVYWLTAHKEKEQLRSNKNDVRSPSSVRLPSSILIEKRENLYKPLDNKRTEGTFAQPTSTQNGSSRRAQKLGSQTSTSADSQPSGVAGTRSPNTGRDGLPHVVEKSSTAPSRADLESNDWKSNDWKSKAKEEDEKRLREKEEQLRALQVITSAEGGYVFSSVCLSVCLSVRRITENS